MAHDVSWWKESASSFLYSLWSRSLMSLLNVPYRPFPQVLSSPAGSLFRPPASPTPIGRSCRENPLQPPAGVGYLAHRPTQLQTQQVRSFDDHEVTHTLCMTLSFHQIYHEHREWFGSIIQWRLFSWIQPIHMSEKRSSQLINFQMFLGGHKVDLSLLEHSALRSKNPHWSESYIVHFSFSGIPNPTHWKLWSMDLRCLRNWQPWHPQLYSAVLHVCDGAVRGKTNVPMEILNRNLLPLRIRKTFLVIYILGPIDVVEHRHGDDLFENSLLCPGKLFHSNSIGSPSTASNSVSIGLLEVLTLIFPLHWPPDVRVSFPDRTEFKYIFYNLSALSCSNVDLIQRVNCHSIVDTVWILKLWSKINFCVMSNTVLSVHWSWCSCKLPSSQCYPVQDELLLSSLLTWIIPTSIHWFFGPTLCGRFLDVSTFVKHSWRLSCRIPTAPGKTCSNDTGERSKCKTFSSWSLE